MTRRALGAMAAALVALAVPSAVRAEDAAGAVPTDVRPVEVTTRPITSFARANGSQKRFGRLEFRGGLVLNSPAKAFGGFSGLILDAEGRRFTAVSDEGGWLTGELFYEAGALAGVRNARMGPIRGLGGRALDKKRDLDAEAITLVDGTLARGTVFVGFERNHRIGRFSIVDGALSIPQGYLKLPPEAKRMKSNKGFEAVAVLQGGPYKGSPIAFSERFAEPPAVHTGWLWVKGEPQRLTLPDIGEFEVTDAASLVDGSLLVLERRFRWTEGVKMRLRRFPADQVKPGATMEGETLIEADLAYEIDNMEGLAVHRSPRGETILTMMSDDNFNSFLQRTILLQFALIDEKPAAARQ